MSSHKYQAEGSLHIGFEVKDLFMLLSDATHEAKVKMQKIKEMKEEVQVGSMFEMQMLMNHLSQISEMATNIVVASHSSIMAMTRGLKQ